MQGARCKARDVRCTPPNRIIKRKDFMVYFNLVEKRSIYYRFWRRWLGRFFTAVYYRRFVVKGVEYLPPVGTPHLIVGNHQNGLLDALCVLFGLPERHTPIFLARADIFKKPAVAKILCFLKILPVYRQRDGKDQLEKNDQIFDFAARMAGEGFSVTLFPEGHHQEGHYLGQFKKGFARIAFAAAERKHFPPDMVVVPAANYYKRHRGLRTEAMLVFGPPVPLSDYYDIYKENPVRAMVLLAQELENRVRDMMLDTPNVAQYAAMDAWRELARKPEERGVEAQLAADKAWAEKVRQMPQEEVEKKGAAAVSLLSRLRAKGFTPAEWPTALKPKEWASKLLCALIYAPMALCGFLLAVVPLGVSRHYAEKFSKAAKTDMLYSTFHFVLDFLLSVVLYLLLAIVYAALVRAAWWMLPVVFFVCFAFRVAYVEYRLFIVHSYRQLRATMARKDTELAAAIEEFRERFR